MPRGRPVCRRVRPEPCRECGVRVARPADEYCSDLCAQAFERRAGVEPGREAVGEGTADGALWVHGMRINLQNSA